MTTLLAIMTRHGYALLFGIVLAEAIGLPMPAALALVTAGAAAASAAAVNVQVALVTALIAMLLGDCLLFIVGRYTGWGLLGLLCRISVNPETCILRSAESFYKRGKLTLLVAKFIPGVNTMAPPLAGSMRMKATQFLRYDLAGAALYIGAYFALGYIFRDFLVAISRGLQTAGHAFEMVVILAVAAYVGYRTWLYRKYAVYRVVPRVQVEELARRLADEKKDEVLIADVRSHGYYDGGSERIKGSVRIEPNNLAEEVKQLSRDKDIYLYCT